MIRKIVIASDSFKGSLTSQEVAEAAAEGVRRVLPECEATGVVISDGGEGTAEAMATGDGWTRKIVTVHDPLGRCIEACYFMSEDGKALMEMASASGLTLLKAEERNPLLTSTYGTGEMMLDAIRNGCRSITIGIGGSATNDGGTGMLEALGFRFMDRNGRQINGLCGARLSEIASICRNDVARCIMDTEITVACDVDSPFCGPDGATHVFASQKGADSNAIRILEEGMKSLCDLIRETVGTDLADTAGAGAAGGLGGAFTSFLNARLTKGTDAVLDAIGFDGKLMDADIVITGEGRIDAQTGKGKTVSGILERARRHGIPVIAIAGIVDMSEEEARERGFASVLAIGPRPQNESDLENAMLPEVAKRRISDTVAKALESLSPSSCRESL